MNILYYSHLISFQYTVPLPQLELICTLSLISGINYVKFSDCRNSGRHVLSGTCCSSYCCHLTATLPPFPPKTTRSWCWFKLRAMKELVWAHDHTTRMAEYVVSLQVLHLVLQAFMCMQIIADILQISAAHQRFYVVKMS